MAYFTVDKDGSEYIFQYLPKRDNDAWYDIDSDLDPIWIPKGSIKKLTGKDLTWDDEPLQITN